MWTMAAAAQPGLCRSLDIGKAAVPPSTPRPPVTHTWNPQSSEPMYPSSALGTGHFPYPLPLGLPQATILCVTPSLSVC